MRPRTMNWVPMHEQRFLPHKIPTLESQWLDRTVQICHDPMTYISPWFSRTGDSKVKARPCSQTSRTPISQYSTYDPDPTGSTTLISSELSTPDEPPAILLATWCDQTIFMVSAPLPGSAPPSIRDSMNLQHIPLRQPLLWI
jgi:hypothetical protein